MIHHSDQGGQASPSPSSAGARRAAGAGRLGVGCSDPYRPAQPTRYHAVQPAGPTAAQAYSSACHTFLSVNRSQSVPRAPRRRGSRRVLR